MDLLFSCFAILAFSCIAQSSPSIIPNDDVRQLVSDNLYSSYKQYINPDYRRKLRSTMKSSNSDDAALIKKYLQVPTAVWLPGVPFVSGKGHQLGKTLRKEIRRISATGETKIVTFVVYNLPNRDCAAGASTNDICCNRDGAGNCQLFDQSGNCEDGLAEYKSNYIDKIAIQAKKYCDRVPMAFLIEPDAFPLIVTNTDKPTCGQATQAGYRAGIKYAVETIKEACPSSMLYLDAGNPSWLGWKTNTDKYISEVAALGISNLLRGFVINVSGYDGLGDKCSPLGVCLPSGSGASCCATDACGWSSHWNIGFNCLNYAQSLHETALSAMSFNARILIDTSRNGVENSRASCSNWCNIKKAGTGMWPTSETADTNIIDAYLWVKPPGESDGCTQILPDGGQCPSFAWQCESDDSIGKDPSDPRAPEAGQWFEFQLKELMRNGV